MSHANAVLTPKGRLRLARGIVERFRVSVATAALYACLICLRQ